MEVVVVVAKEEADIGDEINGPLIVALRLERLRGDVGVLVGLEVVLTREEADAEVGGALEAVDLTEAVVDIETKRFVVVVVVPLVEVDDVSAAMAEDVDVEVDMVAAVDVAAAVAEEEEVDGAAFDCVTPNFVAAE